MFCMSFVYCRAQLNKRYKGKYSYQFGYIYISIVAQRIEYVTFNHSVAGSNPVGGMLFFVIFSDHGIVQHPPVESLV